MWMEVDRGVTEQRQVGVGEWSDGVIGEWRKCRGMEYE